MCRTTNLITTLETLAGSNPDSCDESLRFQQGGNPETLTLYGTIPPGGSSCVETISIDDPAVLNAACNSALKLALEQRGVHITGIPRSKHASIGEFANPTPRESTPDSVLFSTFKSSPITPPNCVEMRLLENMGERLATHTSPPLVEDVTFTLTRRARIYTRNYFCET